MHITEITPVKKETDKKIRLAPYCRVSSDSSDQRHSFATQIQYYSEYTKKHPEYELVDIYADEGLSGTDMKKRDEQNRLLRDCQRGKVDRIIVKSVSRFARNTEELLVTMRMLKEIGVSVYFEEQGIDTDKLNMEIFLTFPGMIAQQESEAISGNMRWSYQKRISSGEFNCTCPAYGYNLIDGKMVINEIEAVVIRRIFSLYLQGVGMQAIANLMNEEAVPRRYGYSKWHHMTIRYILTNERYMGEAILQKTYTTETLPFKSKRNNGKLLQYHVKNSNPAIVTKETFEAVQELLKSRQTSRCKKSNLPLSGKLRCPDCGNTFRRVITAGTAYWTCATQTAGQTDCTHRRVREEMVYETFTDMVGKLQENQKELLGALIHQVEIMQNRTSLTQGRIWQIDKEIADLGAKNLILARLHTSGALTAAEHSKQSAEIGNRITELRTERRKELAEDDDYEWLSALKDLNETLKEYVPCGEFDSDLFEQIIEKVTVDSNASLTFKLTGNIELTEEINENRRCKSA